MTRRVVQGFRLPDRSTELTDAEVTWLTFLRDLYPNEAQSPTLKVIQVLRATLWGQKIPD
jgi:hypothetical protein